MKRFAVINHKGGTAKTTVSVNIAYYLATFVGLKVLLIDNDTQGNVADHLLKPEQKPKLTIANLLKDQCQLNDCIINARPNLDLIISGRELAEAEGYLKSRPGSEMILRRKLVGLEKLGYDVVIIDCSPGINTLNYNALNAVDHLIIPVVLEYLAVVGVKQIIDTLDEVNEIFREQNPLDVGLVVPCRFDEVTAQSKEALEFLRSSFPEAIITPPIHSCVKVSEAPGEAMSVFEYYEYLKPQKKHKSLERILAELHQVGKRVIEIE